MRVRSIRVGKRPSERADTRAATHAACACHINLAARVAVDGIVGQQVVVPLARSHVIEEVRLAVQLPAPEFDQN